MARYGLVIAASLAVSACARSKPAPPGAETPPATTSPAPKSEPRAPPSFPTSSCTKNAAAATVLAIGTSDTWLSGSGALDHWNGKTWTSIPSPARDPPGTDIWGARPDDVWITAGPSPLHWNGQTLSLVSPSTEIKSTDWLSAVWGSDTNDV